MKMATVCQERMATRYGGHDGHPRRWGEVKFWGDRL